MVCNTNTHTQNGLAYTHNIYNKENTPIQQMMIFTHTHTLVLFTYNRQLTIAPHTRGFVLVYNEIVK